MRPDPSTWPHHNARRGGREVPRGGAEGSGQGSAPATYMCALASDHSPSRRSRNQKRNAIPRRDAEMAELMPRRRRGGMGWETLAEVTLTRRRGGRRVRAALGWQACPTKAVRAALGWTGQEAYPTTLRRRGNELRVGFRREENQKQSGRKARDSRADAGGAQSKQRARRNILPIPARIRLGRYRGAWLSH